MKCVVCKHGETRPGKATITLERGGATLVVKGVPARICDNCGESYVDQETTLRLTAIAEDAFRAGVQVDVREFVAAQRWGFELKKSSVEKRKEPRGSALDVPGLSADISGEEIVDVVREMRQRGYFGRSTKRVSKSRRKNSR